MWVYEKRLQYPVNITQTNAKLAQVIISQFGGPDGELAASQRYLSQRYTMPDGMTKGLLNDIGTEEYSRQLLRLSADILPYLILHTIQCPPEISRRDFFMLLPHTYSLSFNRIVQTNPTSATLKLAPTLSTLTGCLLYDCQGHCLADLTCDWRISAWPLADV